MRRAASLESRGRLAPRPRPPAIVPALRAGVARLSRVAPSPAVDPASSSTALSASGPGGGPEVAPAAAVPQLPLPDPSEPSPAPDHVSAAETVTCEHLVRDQVEQGQGGL